MCLSLCWLPAEWSSLTSVSYEVTGSVFYCEHWLNWDVQQSVVTWGEHWPRCEYSMCKEPHRLVDQYHYRNGTGWLPSLCSHLLHSRKTGKCKPYWEIRQHCQKKQRQNLFYPLRPTNTLSLCLSSANIVHSAGQCDWCWLTINLKL